MRKVFPGRRNIAPTELFNHFFIPGYRAFTGNFQVDLTGFVDNVDGFAIFAFAELKRNLGTKQVTELEGHIF